MSGVKFRDLERVPDSDIVCLLQCAHRPGAPLQLWVYHSSLPSLQEDQNDDAMSQVWDFLLNFDPERGKE